MARNAMRGQPPVAALYHRIALPAASKIDPKFECGLLAFKIREIERAQFPDRVPGQLEAPARRDPAALGERCKHAGTNEQRVPGESVKGKRFIPPQIAGLAADE